MVVFACVHECQCPSDFFEVIVFLALRKCEITKQTYFALIHWCSAIKTLHTIPEVYEEMSFVPVKPQPPPSPHRWAASCSLLPAPVMSKGFPAAHAFIAPYRIKQGRTRLPLFPQKTAHMGL